VALTPATIFSATDRAPEPGGYLYMTQGAAAVGDLLVPFTILTNAGQKETVRGALKMIAAAEQLK
jgi:hypothetical protein